MATEKYTIGYASTGNQATGAVADLLNVAKPVCTKLLMNTVKRDLSATEAAFETLPFPLYKCTHQFQNVSFTSSRVLERNGITFTRSTLLEKYLERSKEDHRRLLVPVCVQAE